MISRRLKLFILTCSISAHAQTVEELQKSLTANPDNIRMREQLAHLHADQKKWDQVIALLNPNTDVASPRGYLLLASAYHESKDFENVLRVIRLLSEKRPKDYHVHYMLGDARLKYAATLTDINDRQATENQGIESFRTAIRIKKAFRPVHQALVNYFLKVNLNHEAREQLQEMLKVFGQKGEIHADLCRLYSVDGFLSQAVRHCMRAMQLEPGFAESYVYLGQAYYDQKELEKAETTLVSAAKKFPNSEFVQYGAGQFFLKKSNFPVAIKYLKRAVDTQPGSARAQLALAQSLFESGMTAEALPYFVKACQLTTTAQTEVLGAAARLRLKGNGTLAGRYSQAAGGCKRP
jgi:tetratricopeptide (TPR) repeat protein